MTAAVQLESVTAGYRGKAAITDVDLAILKGEMVGLVGPSGSGKTTILRTLTGQADVYAGTVRLLGRSIRPGRPSLGVGYVPQLSSIEPDLPIRAEDAVLTGLAATSRRTPWYTRAERGRARDLMDRLGLSGYYRQPVGELSGGQQQRLLLARAMIPGNSLVMLDEPTSGIDLRTLSDILGLLDEINSDGVTVVLTTHDLNFVAGRLPRVVCLQGSVIADGSPDTVMRPDIIERTYGAKVRVTYDKGRPIVIDNGQQR
ncbi:MAG: metal ABC transporter ATP-binding protein [Actinomycetia bacterium]|nr:metal ABC transporter ATP-binding protein [Actinomycetes bacterium]MCH9700802.1 metal ABC transporter ATP-binding protein [Actinomycetes bacterium]MCH9762458.1 metal ABC transporter ATP-binding protein [Actinomycetes bacterium]